MFCDTQFIMQQNISKSTFWEKSGDAGHFNPLFWFWRTMTHGRFWRYFNLSFWVWRTWNFN